MIAITEIHVFWLFQGMSFSSGLYCRKHIRGSEDAETVARLRKAGGIPLAITNTSEVCMWWESHNRVHGRTNNPYNTSRIVGGSSGGEACIQAAAGNTLIQCGENKFKIIASN